MNLNQNNNLQLDEDQMAVVEERPSANEEDAKPEQKSKKEVTPNPDPLWVREVLTNLKNQPAYSLIFGICCLLSLTGVVTLFNAKSEVRLIGLFLAVLMLGIAYLVIRAVEPNRTHDKPVLSETNAPRRPQNANSYNQGIMEAFRIIESSVYSPLLKSDLAFALNFHEFTHENCEQAKVSMNGSFVVENYSDESKDFNFTSQIDVSRNVKGDVGGSLRVTEYSTGSVILEPSYKYKIAEDKRGMQRTYKYSLRIPAKTRYRFVWKTEPYELDLPYKEFWATAHPVLGITIEIDLQDTDQYVADADCYRIDEDPSKFYLQTIGSKYTFTADGPFLPYQGMFVRVERKAQG